MPHSNDRSCAITWLAHVVKANSEPNRKVLRCLPPLYLLRESCGEFLSTKIFSLAQSQAKCAQATGQQVLSREPIERSLCLNDLRLPRCNRQSQSRNLGYICAGVCPPKPMLENVHRTWPDQRNPEQMLPSKISDTPSQIAMHVREEV